MAGITVKIGDTIVWNIQHNQSAGTSADLTGFMIDIDAQHKTTNTELFNVTSNGPTTDRYIDTTGLAQGSFTLVIKDTHNFVKGDYLVDIEYTDANGIRNSTKSFNLKVVERL